MCGLRTSSNPQSRSLSLHRSEQPRQGTRPDEQTVRARLIDDPLVRTACELPAFGGQLDAEQRVKRLREVLHQLPVKCTPVCFSTALD